MTLQGTPRRPMGRPRGVVRAALAEWAKQWCEAGRSGGVAVSELAAVVPGMNAKSPSDMRLLRQTLSAMLRAGELVAVGRLPRPGNRGRPPGLYAPRPKADATNEVQASANLASALGAWGAPAVSAGYTGEGDD